MDLYIETLTGTVFELRVSPFETIFSIKSKVQRLEGIPISQQHLIWQTIQLDDEYCLHDYNIGHGATLKLVLAMRGGPINTRRISVEDPSLQEMADYMDANKEEIWETLMQDNQQVTLLVFRDGDQLNFFRVYDRGDGTLTPYSESISPNSEEDQEEEVSDESNQVSKQENAVTKDKMKLLKEQLALKSSSSKNASNPFSCPVPPVLATKHISTALSKRRLRFSKSSATNLIPIPSRHGVVPKTESAMRQYELTELTPSPTKADTHHRHSKLGVTRNSHSHRDDNDIGTESITENAATKKESVRRRILPPIAHHPKMKEPTASSSKEPMGLATMHSIAENMPPISNEPKRLPSKSSRHRSTTSAAGIKQSRSTVKLSSLRKQSPLKSVTAALDDEDNDDDHCEFGTGVLPSPGHIQLPRINVNPSLLMTGEQTNGTDAKHMPTNGKKATSKLKSSHRHVLKPLGTLEARSPVEVSSTTPPELRDWEPSHSAKPSKSLDAPMGLSPPYCELDEILKEAQLQDLLRDSIEYDNYKKLLSWVRPRLVSAIDQPDEINQDAGTSISYHAYAGEDPMNERMESRLVKRVPSRSGKLSPERSAKVNLRGTVAGGHAGLLPPMNMPGPPNLAPSKKRLRCSVCTKKLGLATTYHCRCGSAFCGVHRYPETHPCSFDFKTEGRKLLQKSNPVVAAPKLPKI